MKTTERKKDGRTNGDQPHWVDSVGIERVVGVAWDELNVPVPGHAPIIDSHWVKSSGADGYILFEDGSAVESRGSLVVWDAHQIDSAVRRGTMRPDVAIIDATTKTWRITGQ